MKTLLCGLLILNSCSLPRQEASVSGVGPSAKWFKINPEHALEDTAGPKTHLFFDASSTINWPESTVKFVSLTPQDSQFSYGFDLASGQPFTQHEYCKQNDVWGQYAGSVNRPPYAQGFIPRVLDQSGGPQKIIYFSKNKLEPFKQYEAKVIAGYIESVCPTMDCPRAQWQSRLVLIGVDTDDVSLHHLGTEGIKEKLNWPKVKAHLENAEGKNFIGSNTYPRIRVSEIITRADALNFFKKRAKFFKGSELLGIQKSCHELYDKLWRKVGEVRLEDLPAKNAEEVKQKAEVINLLKSNGEPVGFQKRFELFSTEHYRDILTCSKFVYSGSINQDHEKFWFLNFVKGFYGLYQQGYYFHCGSNGWKRNIIKENGEYLYNVSQTLKECKVNQIDMAMNYMKNFIRSEKEKTSEFLRFIDYDNQGMGTHGKIYNWVHFPHTKLSCNENKHSKFLQSLSIFVDDVSWKNRAPRKEYDDKVIY